MKRTKEEVLNKKLLFSVVYKDGSGATVSRKQGCGLITDVTDAQVILQMPDGSEFTLPPDIEFDEGIKGGDYTLKDGSVVKSPDFTVTYTVIAPRT